MNSYKEEIEIISNEEKGQALFEFIIFLPFLMYMVTVLINSGNAINASINQQKATRGYAYHLLKGNSTVPTTEDLKIYRNAGASQSASYVIGYAGGKSGENYYGSCYKFNKIPGANIPEETCEDISGETITDFVRVFTFYGLCGETYTISNNKFYRNYFQRGLGSCIIK